MIILDLIKLKLRMRRRVGDQQDAARKMIADRERRAFDAAAARFHACAQGEGRGKATTKSSGGDR